MLKILLVFALVLPSVPTQTHAQNGRPSSPPARAVPEHSNSPASQPEHQEHLRADVNGVPLDIPWENFNQGVREQPLRSIYFSGVIYYIDELQIPRSTGYIADLRLPAEISFQ
jgi:hypothetical protein